MTDTGRFDAVEIRENPSQHSITFTWLVRDDGDSRQVAQLDVMHIGKPSYAYVATLRRVCHSSAGMKFMVFGGVQVLRERAVRYNARSFQQFADKARSMIPEIVASNEKAAAIFDPAGTDA